MNRRDFFRVVAGGCVAVAGLNLPLVSSAADNLAKRLSLSEVVNETLRKHRDELVEAMLTHNKLLAELSNND